MLVSQVYVGMSTLWWCQVSGCLNDPREFLSVILQFICYCFLTVDILICVSLFLLSNVICSLQHSRLNMIFCEGAGGAKIWHVVLLGCRWSCEVIGSQLRLQSIFSLVCLQVSIFVTSSIWECCVGFISSPWSSSTSFHVVSSGTCERCVGCILTSSQAEQTTLYFCLSTNSIMVTFHGTSGLFLIQSLLVLSYPTGHSYWCLLTTLTW